jgi:hypothetical protein
METPISGEQRAEIIRVGNDGASPERAAQWAHEGALRVPAFDVSGDEAGRIMADYRRGIDATTPHV